MTQPETPENSTTNGKANGKSKKGPMKERSLLFLDLETTGLNPGLHEITEIGALLVSQPDFKVLETYQSKVMPTHLETASPTALQIGHFKLETWQREAKPLETALAELAKISRGAILSGFNLTFDWAFLQTAFNQVGMEDPFYYHRFDIMSAAYTILFERKELSKYSLNEVCRFFGVTNRAAHTAFADAEATYEAFLGLMRYQSNKPSNEKTSTDPQSQPQA